MGAMRVLFGLFLVVTMAAAWSTTTDGVYDDSLDDDSTVATLAINEDDKYKNSQQNADKLDQMLTDDTIKSDEDGEELDHEIGGALQSLQGSMRLDDEAKDQEKKQAEYDKDGLGESLGMSEDDSKRAPAKLEGAYEDFESTEKLYDTPDDSQELGEDDDVEHFKTSQ